jgi:hypothetical protein
MESVMVWPKVNLFSGIHCTNIAHVNNKPDNKNKFLLKCGEGVRTSNPSLLKIVKNFFVRKSKNNPEQLPAV